MFRETTFRCPSAELHIDRNLEISVKIVDALNKAVEAFV